MWVGMGSELLWSKIGVTRPHDGSRINIRAQHKSYCECSESQFRGFGVSGTLISYVQARVEMCLISSYQ